MTNLLLIELNANDGGKRNPCDIFIITLLHQQWQHKKCLFSIIHMNLLNLWYNLG